MKIYELIFLKSVHCRMNWLSIAGTLWSGLTRNPQNLLTRIPCIECIASLLRSATNLLCTPFARTRLPRSERLRYPNSHRIFLQRCCGE